MEMGARRLIRGAMALACVALVLIAACFVPGTAWAQTVQFQNRATAEMDESGVITGTCSTTAVFLPNSDVVTHFEVLMPDGTLVQGQCMNYGLAVPANATYAFTATPNGDGSYSVSVESGMAEWVVFGDGHIERGAPDPSQRIGNITWWPSIMRKGAISLVKSSSNPSITANNACYSLEGAVYGVYASPEAAQAHDAATAMQTFATDANGNWSSEKDFEEGTYYVAEIAAPVGYALDAQVYSVQVVADQTTRVNGEDGTVEDGPTSNPVTLWATKGDPEMAAGRAQGSGTLAGTQFTIRYFDGYYDASSLPATPTRTWVVATGADGRAVTDDEHKIAGDEFYRMPDGRVTLPLGTVSIEETLAPAGYLPNGNNRHVMQITSDDTAETVYCYQAPAFFNDIVRGGVTIGKTDRQNGGFLPQGAASLEGTVFAIVSENDQPVGVDGAFFPKGAVVKTVEAHFDGSRCIATTGPDCLPCGTYTAYEVEGSDGYLYDDGSRAWRRTFSVTEAGQIVDLTGADVAASNQVVRGDFAFSKIDGFTAARLGTVPFLVTSKTTGEAHVLVTDANGMASTAASWNAHTKRTNANDAALGENASGPVEEALLDPSAGIWFSGRADATCEPDDSLGALPYDTYTVTELRAKANEGYELAKFDVIVTRNGWELDLGTVDDNSGPIVTTSLADENGVKLAPAGEAAIVVDSVGFANLDMRQRYTMKGTMHLVNDDGTDGGVVAEGSTTFMPTSSAGFVDVEFAIDTSSLKGARIVAFEQLVDEQETVQATHEDLTFEGQTIRVPSIETTLSDGADGDHEAVAEGTIELVDTVAFEGLTPGDAYTLNATLHLRGEDGADAGAALDGQGREIRARQSFVAEESEGTVDVKFTFTAPDLDGKTFVAFEELERKGNVYATHADIADDGQSVTFVSAPPEPVTPTEPEPEPEPETPAEPEPEPEPEKPAEDETPATPEPAPTKPAPEKPAAIAKTGDNVAGIALLLIPTGALAVALSALAVRRLEREQDVTIKPGKPRR